MFLEIQFHDNDFIMPMMDALEQVWEMVKQNGHMESPEQEAYYTFKRLEENGLLFPIIHRLIVLNILKGKVENIIRFIPSSWSSINESQKNKIASWIDHKTNKSLPMCKDIIGQRKDGLTYTEYFSDMKVVIRRTLSSEDTNGEHAWLDLYTGYIFAK